MLTQQVNGIDNKKELIIKFIYKLDENLEKISLNGMNKNDEVRMIRVESPHILKKSLPDSYKFMTHSSVCLGITSKDLVEQFQSFQSNSYSNEPLKN